MNLKNNTTHTVDDIQDKVFAILKKYVYKKAVFETASPDSHILNDLKINSARMVDIILDVEDEFLIEVNDKYLESIRTVKDVVNLINRELQGKG